MESILCRELENNSAKISVAGTGHPSAFGFFLSQMISKKINTLPHLVVCEDSASVGEFIEAFEFFDPQRRIFSLTLEPSSPYSSVAESSKRTHEKMRFLYHCQQSKPGDIFVAPVAALLQKTLPYNEFTKRIFEFSVGSELPPQFSSLLESLGYLPAPLVEDAGTFALRGGILDIFPPSAHRPIRLELFGDQIESLREFDPSTQRSLEPISKFSIVPAREYFFSDERIEGTLQKVRSHFEGRPSCPLSEKNEILRSLVQKNQFPGIEGLLPFFHERLELITDYFSSPLNVWLLNDISLSQASDRILATLRDDFRGSASLPFALDPSEYFVPYEQLHFPGESFYFQLNHLDFFEADETKDTKAAGTSFSYPTRDLREFPATNLKFAVGSDSWISEMQEKISQLKKAGFAVLISFRNLTLLDRLKLLFEKMDFHVAKASGTELTWQKFATDQQRDRRLIHFIPRSFPRSLKIEEDHVILLRDEDFFGQRAKVRSKSSQEDFSRKAKQLNFGDLSPGDLVVHVKHGVGQYEGLRIMNIQGVDSEFIQVSYKDKDKLYLPVYRVAQLQKYSSAVGTASLDKLGGQSWEKTKTQVKKHLKDIASELLELYAKRSQIQRAPFEMKDEELLRFENAFPFEETEDQNRAIEDIKKDLFSSRPMDRLICGDVGFGKTEVAMRAVFMALSSGRQVAVLAPTTVLTFQHVENFKKRFAQWPFRIEVLNRFASPTQVKSTLSGLKDGQVNLVIGTHRLLSKDVEFKNLGLLVVDEEQKFGVVHKEKIKKLKVNVDTLTLSATPIPRTLNMSLMGIRDLSLINTAPVDRLPVRTFVSKFDEATIRKAITSEIARGGQVYFIHNRVQSIYGIADEIRAIVPEVRIRVAHGQMEEDELEKTMLAFFHHEVDVLVCTALVESGMDVARANTMFIESAHMFGLSQLYQLRGRVGRSSARAYCFLMLPRGKQIEKDAQERLKIIQENTALGSGIKIAQYDLELRGSGNLLGEDQSGHVNAVGYELYMDLLNEAFAAAKGETVEENELEPEINLRIPALIPDSYISDIRLRLSYYKALSEIRNQDDLDQIEADLKDQFGEIPEPTLNLLGLMLIRRQCKDLGVRDVSAGLKNISLVFTERTRLKPQTAIQLAMRENKKYSLTPDQRLNIRMNQITWANVYQELAYLLSLVN